MRDACDFAAYLQYSLCRSDSIQRRAVASASSGFKGDVASLALTERAELDLAASLLRLDDVLLSVEADLMPNRYGVGGASRCRRGWLAVSAACSRGAGVAGTGRPVPVKMWKG